MRKRILSVLFALALCLSLIPATALADGEITGDIPEGMTIVGTVITKYTGDAEDLVIPAGVTEIEEEVFQDNTKLKTVTFPTTLEAIGEKAMGAPR